jgi:hypothetical protein
MHACALYGVALARGTGEGVKGKTIKRKGIERERLRSMHARCAEFLLGADWCLLVTGRNDHVACMRAAWGSWSGAVGCDVGEGGVQGE